MLAVIVIVAAGPPFVAPLLGVGSQSRLLPPRGRSVDIGNGTFLNVVETGQGAPVVLVHGLPSNAYDWADMPAKLAALGHRVIAYDRVGYGFSSRALLSPSSYESNADDLLRLLAALDIPHATLVGWSYGGAVVQTLALRHPEKIDGLVLVGSVGPALWAEAEDPLHALIASPLGGPLLQWIAAIPPLSRMVTRESVVRAFGGAGSVPAEWEEYTRAMLALPGTLQTFVMEAKRGNPGELHPEQIDAKVLVIHGANDLLVPLDVGRDLDEKLPHSRLIVVNAGSHMLPVTHPDLLAKEIHAFVTN